MQSATRATESIHSSSPAEFTAFEGTHLSSSDMTVITRREMVKRMPECCSEEAAYDLTELKDWTA